VSSFGEELKRERELREITLREISEATKVNLRYLDALERNDFERLPGGVFNKGFVRAYAEYIGVDPETMVNAYLLEERGQQSERVDGLSEDLFRPAGGSAIRSHTAPDTPGGDAGRGVLVKAVVVVAAVGVLAAATFLIWWWWWGSDDGSTPDSRAPAEPTTVIEPASGTPPSTAGTEPVNDPPDDGSSAAAMATLPSSEAVEPEPPPVRRDPPAAVPPGVRVPQVRVLLARPTQGRLNCDNRRVEILDGLAADTEMVFRCRKFLLVDALDGGAVMVQPEGSEATPLGPDGLPVVGRYVVPARPRSSGGEP